MTNPVSICNLALSRLGAKRIKSLEVGIDNSNNAATCAVFYQPTVEEVLASHDWSFATRRKQLSELAGDNRTGFVYQYQITSEIIAIQIPISEDGTELTDEDYIIESGVLYCNLSPCWVKYTTKTVDATQFSPRFVKLLALKLASEIAFVITNDQNNEVKFLQLYEAELRKVKGTDTYTKKNRKRGRFTWSEMN